MHEPRSSFTKDQGEGLDDQTTSVLDLLRARMRGERDEFRVALTVEGGGMRGVVSGAMLIALRDLGITDCIDVLYGTSSGSINVAYFAAGASWDALSVYYDHLTKGFVRPAIRGRSGVALNMAHLEDVMRNRVPLEVSRMRSSGIDARIVLTNVDQSTAEIVSLAELDDPISSMLAGSWLPILAGGPMTLNGQRYFDGGVLYADPLFAAVDEGCTHILAINTSASPGGSEHSRRLRHGLSFALNRWKSGLGRQYMTARQEWDSLKPRLLEAGSVNHQDAKIMRLAPGVGSHPVERLTMNRSDLLEGARAGYASVTSAFGEERNHYFSIT